MRNKIVAGILVSAMTATMFCGCGNSAKNNSGSEVVEAGNSGTGSEGAEGDPTGEKSGGDNDENDGDNSDSDKNKPEPAMITVNDKDLNVIDDNYRTCYEVFVYSFNDSDGDGIGDLKGLTSKLDYINDGDDSTDTDLGCNEIWLMPIMPSTTYHKYDVIDYKDIDPEYGTMADFDEFMEECHKHGINVIIDFVMNHSSTQTEWFKEASAYLQGLGAGEEPDLTKCPYVDYYNFSNEAKAGYEQLGNSNWYYEARFWSEMPDLNLASEAVRNEFTDIVQFWLDKGVDGFRLDAVKEYYTNSPKDSIEVLDWFTKMVKEKKEDAYIVGEAWCDYLTYSQYYKSGMDSLFDFAFADNDGYISKVLNGNAKSGASTYGLAIDAVQKEIEKYTDSYINAPFYTNHDMGRSAGYYSGDDAMDKVKMAQAMNLLMSGNAFLYYGEELGMKGAGQDENKRLGMVWSNDTNAEGMCKGPKDATGAEMIYGSLEDQKDDPYSIYNYVKQAIRLRNIYPEIARGKTSFMKEISDDKVCVLVKDYEGSQLALLFNPTDAEVEYDLSKIEVNGKSGSDLEVAGILQTEENAPTVDGTNAILPQFSVMILK